MEKRATKKTREQTYYQYLVKWKGKPTDHASWVTTTELQKFNVDLETLTYQYFLLRESDVGASTEITFSVETGQSSFTKEVWIS